MACGWEFIGGPGLLWVGVYGWFRTIVGGSLWEFMGGLAVLVTIT